MVSYNETIAIVLQNRQAVSALFRVAFKEEATAEFMAVLASEEARDALTLYAQDEGAVADLVSHLATLPNGKDAEAYLDKVRSEYVAMFIGPGAPIAPYWESVYTDPREMLFIESTQDVKGWYEKEGYTLDAGKKEPADSLPLQLDFIAQLAERSAQAYGQEDFEEACRLIGVQSGFERAHMLSWLPAFAARAENAPTRFLYPQMCAAVSSFVAFDAALLQEIEESFESV